MPDAIKILILIGSIAFWLYSRMKKRENKQQSNRQTSKPQDVPKQPEDIFPQWSEEVAEVEPAEVETEPAMSSLEERIESKSPAKTEPTQEKKIEKKEEPKEKKSPMATIAGMPLTSENIRHGIIFAEILKRRGQNLK